MPNARSRSSRQSAARKATKSSASSASTRQSKKRETQKRSTKTQGTSAPSGTQGSRSVQPTRGSNGRGGLSAADAVMRARRALPELLGRPVEGVLGIDRDHGQWVATVQVVELARIPNTTDVLGEYEAVLDGKGEVVRYHRKRRYQRGQVDRGEG